MTTEIIELKCSNCGAKLDNSLVGTAYPKAKCSYCQTEFLIKDGNIEKINLEGQTIGTWYDREGKLLTNMSDVERKLRDRNYTVVKQTKLPDGKLVSTVWLGLNYNFDRNGPPIIFETMVFPKKREKGELDQDRYATIDEARRGHEVMVNRWIGRKK